MTVVIMFVGACITWPVLFPVNITGGAGAGQLDMLAMSNIDKEKSGGKYRYFAHAGCGMLFFGFVLMLVTRESIFYINLRQAFLLSPVYANRMSARTVLFTSVPKDYLHEGRLRKVFGSAVRNIWIARDTTKVDELVEERDKVAFKLEAAEVKLIKTANGERLKAAKKGGVALEEERIEVTDTETGFPRDTTKAEAAKKLGAGSAEGQNGAGDVESGSLAARWIPMKKRPTHKLGKFGLIGKKVDTINWARTELERLIPETEAAQHSYRSGETALTGSVFIEFAHQSDAQAAFQTLSHHQALHSKLAISHLRTRS